DQRFWIASRARGRYADGSIICGAPDHPAHDDQATTNPTVAIEVLSPSSEGDDDGDKPRAEGVAAPRFHSQPCARRRSVRTQPAPLRCALTLRAGPTGPGQPVIFIAPRY
ncbi:MAG TPA: Uma2 family endonuclease, partial [Kofleriaceae bacterium]|nr:Uma2 family endonuclease [Kofleriaceae bacterium]